jgi:hypothetical protein
VITDGRRIHRLGQRAGAVRPHHGKAKVRVRAGNSGATIAERGRGRAALRAKYRAAQQAAQAEAQDTQRKADAAQAAAAKRQLQTEERQRLLDDHSIGFVPAPRAATDSAKIGRAAEYAALELGSIALLLAEIVEELKKMRATNPQPKKGKNL